MSETFAFIPGKSASQAGPLARYLPTIQSGAASAWLAKHASPGSWVLDPFGAAPQLAVEVARAGYRVLVAANNPVARFLLELAADPPSEEQLRSALAELAATRKGEERLEPHIRNLYTTHCQECGAQVSAQAFLWERGSRAPYGRIYHCPACGDSGERPANREDQEKAAHFAAGGLHQARALERIAPRGDPDRAHAEEALSAYLPRAVYAVFTLINKLESVSAPAAGAHTQAVARQLAALLLVALDQANSLWPYPTARARPRQLTTPRRFRENNVWLALEEAVKALPGTHLAAPLVNWPEHPPESGGIAIFEGRLKDLAEQLRDNRQPQIAIRAVLSALPRPNQAFWTLSALWAGWLWGREAIGPFKSVLRRRRYDWSWHCTALEAAFGYLAGLLPEGTPCFGLVGEAEPGFLSAAVLSAEAAGLPLRGMALRAGSEEAQIQWNSGPEKPAEKKGRGTENSPGTEKIVDLASSAGKAHLRQRGEPAPYLSLHAAALDSLAGKGTLQSSPGSSPADVYNQVQEAFEQAFTYRYGFLRFGGSDRALEVGQWWLRDAELAEAPADISLADRVEMATVRALQKGPGSASLEIDRAVCAALPGLLTPDPEMVSACLESYGELEQPDSDRWQLRASDLPAARRKDLSDMRAALERLGARLGFETGGEHPLLWMQGGEPKYIFYPLASTVFAELVFSNPYPASRSIILLPGARAQLAVFKMRRDPRLRQAIESGWRFLKFRHLRQLAESLSLDRHNLDEQLALDPLTGAPEQMRLL